MLGWMGKARPGGMWGCSPQRWEPVSLPLSRHIFKDSWETSESREGCWLPGPRPGRSPSAPPRALSLPPPSGGSSFLFLFTVAGPVVLYMASQGRWPPFLPAALSPGCHPFCSQAPSAPLPPLPFLPLALNPSSLVHLFSSSAGLLSCSSAFPFRRQRGMKVGC